MKYTHTLVLICISLLGLAQAPALINYQGAARDNAGAPKANQGIGLRFEILQGSATGSVVFTDDQPTGVSTNSLGLFTTQIGKNSSLAGLNWAAGPYFLKVSVDIGGGLVALGIQQINSVPFALSAPAPTISYTNNVLSVGGNTMDITPSLPLTYTNSILTVGTNTVGITTSQQVSLTAGPNVTITPGPNYTISGLPAPTLSLTANNASIAISGGNAVGLPGSPPPTNVTSTAGIASVSSIGTNTYNVNVPLPTYNPVSGVLSFGGANTAVVVPTLGLASGILYVGPTSNSLTMPTAVTLAGTGIATVTGGPGYNVNVAQPVLALSTNSLSIMGSNTVILPAAPTVSATPGGIVTVSGAPNYGVTVPVPTYGAATGILSFGATNITVTPTLGITNGTLLTVGPATNSVNLANIGPWRQGIGSVTLGTTSDNVGINTPGAPSAKLDVFFNGVGTVIKANNTNVANTSPVVDIASSGTTALSVTNLTPGGQAAQFTAGNGQVLFVANNSSTAHAFYSANNDISATQSSAGFFNGGFVAQGKNNASANNFVIAAQSNVATPLFVVRNDGNIGVGTNSPAQRLDVQQNSGPLPVARIMNQSGSGASSVEFDDNSGTAKLAIGHANPSSTLTWGGNSYLNTTNTSDFIIATQSVERMRITQGGNIGIGTTLPTFKLEVIGNTKFTNGSEGDGKVFTSNAAGVANWKSSPPAISIGNLNNGAVTVGTTTTVLNTGSMSFTKVYASTDVDIFLYSRIDGGAFSGVGYISFEIYVDGSPSSTGTKHYMFSGLTEYVSLKGYFPGLGTGSHSITIVAQTNAGTSAGVLMDPSGFGGKILVKETF